MIRGTTPTHTFKLPFSSDSVEECEVVYAQNDREIVRKRTADCEITGDVVKCTLTQAETLEFKARRPLQVQIRVLTTAGKVVGSQIMRVTVEDCLSNEALL